MDTRSIARLLALSLLASSSFSVSARQCSPVLQHGWIRLPPAAMPMMAGFGDFTNACKQAAVVVSATSPAFGEVSIHETRSVDGVNRMRELESLSITPGGSATLKPGGMHLMLMQPKAVLKEGDTVQVTFTLQDGRQLTYPLAVRKSAP